ncbi:MAG: acyloxyacyl hydrolase [Pseudoxanthomonas sp.]
MKWGRAWAAALLLAAGTGSAQAAQWAISAGGSLSQRDWAPAAALDVAGAPRVLGSGRLQWRPVAALTGVGAHAPTWRPDSDRDVLVASAGAALALRDSGWFFSLQGAAANRTTPALSSRLQFVSSLGWQGQMLRVQLRHISNGRIGGGPNLGESMLLVGVRL